MATELCRKCDKAPRSDPETLRSTQIKARKQSTFSNLAKKKTLETCQIDSKLTKYVSIYLPMKKRFAMK